MEAEHNADKHLNTPNRRRPSKIRKWLTRLAMAAAVIGALHYGAWDASLTWPQEKIPEHHKVLGITILYWGRIGKFVLFAAGFVALIDIYGPRGLRKTRDRIDSRADRRMKKIQYLRLGRRMGSTDRYLRQALDSDLSRTALDAHEAIRSLGEWQHSFKHDDEYQNILQRLRDEFENKSRCAYCVEPPNPGRLHTLSPSLKLWECKHGARLFNQQVDAFMRKRFKTQERAALRLYGAKNNFNLYWGVSIAIIWVPIVPGIFSAGLLYALWGLIFFVVAISALLDDETRREHPNIFMRVFTSFEPTRMTLLLLTTWSRIASKLLNRAITMANERRLRTIALLIFIAGTALDLLAS
ncbi:hypothetical protein E1161_13405 [Saccharopolyspora aridisoli]|uniref:Uncharacterized protein n=1 Tax=Saccharopolyspora aridisoli TaxID=2530385 RepID=A0A4R4UT90_9PSEU|nr:hypothetical protein [Saccharopolyspora aridisoli]TDC92364.1 hypothetical protein E1161_13405 [Saccharopolyspora aridisoli]